MKRNIMFLCLIIVAGIWLASFGGETNRATGNMTNDIKEATNLKEKYDRGVKLLKEGAFSKARDELKIFTNKNIEQNKENEIAKNLYYYADARYSEYMPGVNYRLQYEMAFDSINKIPENYAGEFAAEIKGFRKKVTDRIATYKQTEKEQEMEYDKKIHVGDSDVKVKRIMGEPQRKNITTTQNRKVEQWIYGKQYIYIENGRVTGWQE